MATLTLQALTGFLDHIPGASGSRGVEGLNAFLDFVLISRIGRMPAAVLLAVLTVAFTVLVSLRAARERGAAIEAATTPRDRVAKAIPGSGTGAERPISDADRKLMANLLQGAVMQVQHEERMIAARGHEPVVVRLVPQVPIRDHERPRSWLGGEPEMAEHIAWPEIDGRRANFLAQICCADLPGDLWGGIGPREGWLAFFIHPTDYKVRVLHLAELGPAQPGPDLDEDSWFRALWPAKPPITAIRAFPRWPVDVVTVRPGGPDPRREGQSEANFARYKRGYDLASAEHQPFDWPSTFKMLEIAEARVAERLSAAMKSSTVHDATLENVRRALSEAERAPQPPENLIRLRNQAQVLPILIEARAKALCMLQTALPLVQEVAAMAREHAARMPFSQEAVAPIMDSLRTIEWMSVHRKNNESGGPGAEDIRSDVLPLTVHDAESNLWVHDFESLRFDWARHAYCRSPASLPPAVRAYFEELWRDIAAHEMPGMGHVPFRYVHEFDIESDVTLLELPSSNLMGWMFGDVDNLVLTVKRADLAAGRLHRLNVQVTN